MGLRHTSPGRISSPCAFSRHSPSWLQAHLPCPGPTLFGSLSTLPLAAHPSPGPRLYPSTVSSESILSQLKQPRARIWSCVPLDGWGICARQCHWPLASLRLAVLWVRLCLWPSCLGGSQNRQPLWTTWSRPLRSGWRVLWTLRQGV